MSLFSARSAFCLLALTLPLAATAAPKLEWTVVVPPAHILEGVKSVGMGEFSGTQADKLRDYMQAAIVGRTSASLAGLTTNVFKVSSSDTDATLNATVSVPDPVVTDYAEQESRFKDGNTYKVTVYCKKREVTVNVRAGVTAKDGTLLTQMEVGRTSVTRMCKDSPELLRHAVDTGEFTSISNAVEEILRTAAPGLINGIMPYVTGTSGELLVEKAVKDGNKEARDGQIQTAVNTWLAVINVDPYNASAHYNIGLAYETQDDLTNAKAWYNKAGALLAKDEITQSLTRASTRETQVAVLVQKYQMVHTPGMLTADAGATPAVAAQKVTVNGGKNARVPLRAEASEGSAAVVQLPGGMMLTVVEVSGDYVKVSTVDGKEGFLLTKEVDGLK